MVVIYKQVPEPQSIKQLASSRFFFGQSRAPGPKQIKSATAAYPLIFDEFLIVFIPNYPVVNLAFFYFCFIFSGMSYPRSLLFPSIEFWDCFYAQLSYLACLQLIGFAEIKGIKLRLLLLVVENIGGIFKKSYEFFREKEQFQQFRFQYFSSFLQNKKQTKVMKSRVHGLKWLLFFDRLSRKLGQPVPHKIPGNRGNDGHERPVLVGLAGLVADLFIGTPPKLLSYKGGPFFPGRQVLLLVFGVRR